MPAAASRARVCKSKAGACGRHSYGTPTARQHARRRAAPPRADAILGCGVAGTPSLTASWHQWRRRSVPAAGGESRRAAATPHTLLASARCATQAPQPSSTTRAAAAAAPHVKRVSVRSRPTEQEAAACQEPTAGVRSVACRACPRGSGRRLVRPRHSSRSEASRPALAVGGNAPAIRAAVIRANSKQGATHTAPLVWRGVLYSLSARQLPQPTLHPASPLTSAWRARRPSSEPARQRR